MANGDSARELIFRILKTRMSFRQAVQRTLKAHNVDLTFEMLQIMRILWTHHGASQQYLAQRTAKDKACLTNLVNNLVKKELVMRRIDPQDGRRWIVCVTEQGRALSRTVLPLLQTLYSFTESQMSERELNECKNRLERLNEIFEEI